MAGSGCHVNGGKPVSPQNRKKENRRREVCEVDEEDQEEDAFNRWMRPFDQNEEEASKGNTGAEDHGEPVEEGLIPKVKKVVAKPEQMEVEQHMATHIPFREWCSHCVAGKSKIDPHTKGSRDERTVPKVSLDYMYMTSGKQEGQMGMPILVG